MVTTKWNKPETYYKGFLNEEKDIVKYNPVFAYCEKESVIRYDKKTIFSTNDEGIRKDLYEIDDEIICQVAASKYLTSLQIYEYISMAGMWCNRPTICRHLHKLVKRQLLQEVELLSKDKEKGVRVYTLGFWGNQIAYQCGVCLHCGIKYISPKRKREMRLEDSATDIKKVLVANQICLGLLKSHVMMKRFGIRETTRINTDDSYESGKILRAGLTVRLDENNILAYEVVRRNPEAFGTLGNKVTRYWKIVSDSNYIDSNDFGDRAHPQLIICGEDFEHNKEIFNYIKGLENYQEDVTILFTEDLLNLNGERKSIYEITDDEKQIWYELPENSMIDIS